MKMDSQNVCDFQDPPSVMKSSEEEQGENNGFMQERNRLEELHGRAASAFCVKSRTQDGFCPYIPLLPGDFGEDCATDDVSDCETDNVSQGNAGFVNQASSSFGNLRMRRKTSPNDDPIVKNATSVYIPHSSMLINDKNPVSYLFLDNSEHVVSRVCTQTHTKEFYFYNKGGYKET